MHWSKFIISACAITISGCSIGADIPVAEAAVTQFHSMLDAGQYARIYKDTDVEFKKTTPEEKFTKLLTVVKKKMGPVKSTKQVGWNDNATPNGHFISITYQTKFTNGDGVESFRYKIVDKKAALIGYNINSDTLVYN